MGPNSQIVVLNLGVPCIHFMYVCKVSKLYRKNTPNAGDVFKMKMKINEVSQSEPQPVSMLVSTAKRSLYIEIGAAV